MGKAPAGRVSKHERASMFFLREIFERGNGVQEAGLFSAGTVPASISLERRNGITYIGTKD